MKQRPWEQEGADRGKSALSFGLRSHGPLMAYALCWLYLLGNFRDFQNFFKHVIFVLPIDFGTGFPR